MTNRREVDPRTLVLGMQIEVVMRGTVVLNEGNKYVHVRLEDGSTWGPTIPESAKVYEIVELQFCLQGGYVFSKHDGDRHMVPAHRLVQLYQLRDGEYRMHNGFSEDLCGGLRHLRPRADGNYGRPTPR